MTSTGGAGKKALGAAQVLDQDVVERSGDLQRDVAGGVAVDLGGRNARVLPDDLHGDRRGCAGRLAIPPTGLWIEIQLHAVETSGDGDQRAASLFMPLHPR